MNFDIDMIKELIELNKVQWRGHILVRMQQRGIKIKDVVSCIKNGGIIEHYENYEQSKERTLYKIVSSF